ncbi:methyltransferase domain-containing protein [Bacillus sp. ISL-37]|uniref:class I SAM-dependent methyltransferase n=2 Tax=unclassified Bacillus (in: firmicutes) TaxID=185979 RepID=UPI001BED3579|nr:methyltransferase domain-containing protein [Bacillus sp. ISL-37]MBT2695596.1 methyltransferase domain-containing protein [Bacillus sp. ISL-55]
MDAQDKWNRKYMDKLTNQTSPEPNKRLLEMATYLNGGTAIDFASGLGGNSFFLAELGYDMTAIDISDIAIMYVQEQAANRDLNITTKVADLTKERTDLTTRKYDLAVMTYYLERSLFPLVKQVIKDDGYLFFETFYKQKAAGNEHISNQYKLESNELLKEFSEWKILFFEENEQEGRQSIFCQKIQKSIE